jgi:hypothetical protein
VCWECGLISIGFGKYHVDAYNISEQAHWAVLHSSCVSHDLSQASDGRDSDRDDSQPSVAIGVRYHGGDRWTGDGSRPQCLVGWRAARRRYLVGWVALIKGVLFLFLSPEAAAGLYLEVLHYEQLFYLYSAILLHLGVYLTYCRATRRFVVFTARLAHVGRLQILHNRAAAPCVSPPTPPVKITDSHDRPSGSTA